MQFTPSKSESSSAAADPVVIESVTITAKPGEVVAILGPNGCGKTTLLNIVAGLQRPSSGMALIDGAAPEESSVAYVFQNFRDMLLPWRTVLRNVALPLELGGTPKAAAVAQAGEFMLRHGFDVPWEAFPYTLSGGQQQLVSIARALVGSPRVVLLDEPFNQLDSKNHRTVRQRFLALWAESSPTTLLVTHDVEDAVLCAQRLVVLSQCPARIVGEMMVPLAWPRTEALIEAPLFAETEHRARQMLRNGDQAC